jgi:alanyl-tRNA synthetase
MRQAAIRSAKRKRFKVATHHHRPDPADAPTLTTLIRLVTDSMVQQNEWHQKDLDYRSDIHARLDKQDESMIAMQQSVGEVKLEIASMKVEMASLRRHVEALKTKMQLLAWIMMATNTLKQALAAAVSGAEWGKKVFGAVTSICAVLVLVWEFLHSILPAIKYSIAHHKISF